MSHRRLPSNVPPETTECAMTKLITEEIIFYIDGLMAILELPFFYSQHNSTRRTIRVRY